MSPPIPRWMADPDYFSRKDPRRAEHVRRIEASNRIDERIRASSADGSYSVLVTRQESR